MSEMIAIVGMGCLFPNAKNKEEYWENLKNGLDSFSNLTEIQIDKNIENYYNSKPGAPDKIYTKKSCYVRDFKFEPNGYNIVPEELMSLDDVYKWAIYASNEALKDCGYDQDINKLRNCGLILGNLISQTNYAKKIQSKFYNKILTPYIRELINRPDFELDDFEYEDISKYNLTSSGFPATIASQAIGIGGPCFSIDAACASSLYSIKLASYYLNTGKADTVLAGAICKPDYVGVINAFSMLQALPSGGESIPLDKESKGIMVGEGCGFLALRRYSDAKKDNQKIYAVIENTGLSNDAGAKHIVAPDSDGQYLAIKRAYTGISKEVDYLELHATGTTIGDVAEINSIERFFVSDKKIPLIGANKANIGHLLTASGMASIFKVVGAMMTGIIPSTLKVNNVVETSNKKININNIVTKNMPWPNMGKLKRSGINAFGFGGCNAHTILSEYKQVNNEILQDNKYKDIEEIAIVGMTVATEGVVGLKDYNEMIFNCKQVFKDLPKTKWMGLEKRKDLLEHYNLDPDNLPKGAYSEKILFDWGKYKIPPNAINFATVGNLSILQVADSACNDAGYITKNKPRNIAVIVAMENEFNFFRAQERIDLEWKIRNGLLKCGIELNESKLKSLQDIIKESIFTVPTFDDIISGIGNIMASKVSAYWKFNGPTFCLSSMENSVYKAMEIAQFLLSFEDLEAVVIGTLDSVGCFESVIWRNWINRINTGEKTIGFDKRVNGWDIGEATGAIVLRRYKDAKIENAKIYSVIKSMVIKQDNNFNTLKNIPSKTAVESVCIEAMKKANVNPGDIGYLEVSASGIKEEDEAEIYGITKAYSSRGNKKSCVMGSVKANMGHAYNSSGITAVAKVALCLNNSFLPGIPNMGELKYKKLFESSLLKANKLTSIWPEQQDGKKRLAAINSLGMDRSYVHLILEEPPENMRKNLDDCEIKLIDNNKSTKNLKEVYNGREKSYKEIILNEKTIKEFKFLNEIKEEKDKDKAKYKEELDCNLYDEQLTINEFKLLSNQIIKNVITYSGTHLEYLNVTSKYYDKLLKELSNSNDCKGKEIVLDEAQLDELTEGKISNIFGEDFRDVDNYKIRSRMPSKPFNFVSRITKLTSPKGKLEPSLIEWEYDIPEEAWYIINNTVPSFVPIESSHALIVALSYMGCDQLYKGQFAYRALGAKIKMFEGWYKPGDTVRGQVIFKQFTKVGKNILVDYEMHYFLRDKKIIHTKGGAGFFDIDIVRRDTTGVKRPKELDNKSFIKSKKFIPFLKCDKISFSDIDVEDFQQGNLEKCFGQGYGYLKAPVLYTSMMKMLDRVIKVDLSGGAWGLGEIIGEKDIDPNHWVFKAHFKNDPVFPATFLGQGSDQLMSFYSHYIGIHAVPYLVINNTEQDFVGINRVEIRPQKVTIQYRLTISDVDIVYHSGADRIKELSIYYYSETLKNGVITGLTKILKATYIDRG